MSGLIDRQSAIDRIRGTGYADQIKENVIMILMGLPSVQPEANCSEIPNNSDTISRQDAIDALDVGAEVLRRVLDDADIVGAEREKYEWGLGLIESYIADVKELPSAQPEIIRCKDCSIAANPCMRMTISAPTAERI